VNIREPGGAERWVAAGRPLVPSLLVGGIASPILHVSQLASMLDLEVPSQPAATRLAWDSAAVLQGWIDLIRPLDFETLTAPTPSRDRSPRNLTVNVFHPFELLPTAFDGGMFDWDPDLDDARERDLMDASAVVAYASGRRAAWESWLVEREVDLVTRDPQVESPRGRLTFANLLSSQHWHAAYHFRQLQAFLASRGHDLAGAFSLASLAELDLPPEIF
jgi:hypothetical protein